MYNRLSIEDNDFTSLNTTKTLSGIFIYYNNSGLHDYMPSWPFYAPTPLIDINYSFRNSNNIPDTINTNVTLEGIIYHKKNTDSTEAYSFGQMISGMNNLRKIFTDKSYGVLEVKSQVPNQQAPITLHKIEGLVLQNISFDQTEDNWTKSIKYNISLENVSSLYSGINNIEKYVTDRTYTWNIEPVEDIYYVNNSLNTAGKQKTENNNPNINNLNINNNPLKVKDFQQFRVSRKLSAKGLPFVSGSGSSGSGLLNDNTKSYVFAKAWVESMSNVFRTSNNNADSLLYFLPVSGNSQTSSFPFDHKRTVNIDIFDGTYSVDDSWLVLPRSNPYIETYTIESSSDESFVKNVTVQGNIIGLSIYQDPMNIVTAGTGNSGLLTGASGSLITNFDNSLKNDNLNLRPINNYGPLDTDVRNKTLIKRSKYENALSGWLYDVKPYLYRRASLAINTDDRIFTYIRNQNPPDAIRPPHNPIYSKESLLSVVPVGASETHNPFKGTIDYSYNFNNRFNIFSGVISENISLSYENSSDNITETSTLDSTRGAFIQRNSRTNPKKNITVDISILPVNKIEQISISNIQCPLHTGGYLWSTIDQFIQAHAPYSNKNFPKESWTNGPYAAILRQSDGIGNLDDLVTSDNETWNPTTGKYSRSYSWIYQPHSLTFDHRTH